VGVTTSKPAPPSHSSPVEGEEARMVPIEISTHVLQISVRLSNFVKPIDKARIVQLA
jgi:hypothetical protein